MTDLNTVVPVRAIVADDHPLVLLAIDSFVASLSDMRVVGHANDSRSLFGELGRVACDVVVTDLFMPGGAHRDGLEIIRPLKERYPDLALVVLTMSTDVDVLRNVIALGADVILSKRDRIDLLPAAVATALARGCYLGPTIRMLLADAKPARRGAHVRRLLSTREFEVFTCYVSGLGITEIARRTGRSVKTISAQKQAAMKKLSLKTDVDLFRYAIRHGIISGEFAW